MRKLILLILGLAFVLGPFAYAADDKTTCFSTGTEDYKRTDFFKQGLAACRRLITAGKASGAASDLLAYYYRGSGYWKTRMGDLNGALEDYNQAVNLDPSHVEGYDYRADIFKQKGDVARAIADYEMAIRLDPTYAAAYYSRGFIYESQGNIEKARADYTAALAVPEKDRIAKWAQEQAKTRLAALKGQSVTKSAEPRNTEAEVQARLREEQKRRAAAEEDAKKKADELARVTALLEIAKRTHSSQVASRRFALLIGNQRYAERVGPLKNPHEDVALLEAALKKVGFEVVTLLDTNYRTMDLAIKHHISKVREAGNDAISFFYYSGHGASNPSSHINYIIPVDVTDTETSDFWDQSFELSDVIDKLAAQAPDATHYVIFDACRDELKLRSASKSVGSSKGFAPILNTSGILVAYATAPNKTASDIGSGGGPYAKALAEEIVKPGQEAVTMFRNVQLKVKNEIGQDPWLSFPTLRAVYFAGETTPSANK